MRTFTRCTEKILGISGFAFLALTLTAGADVPHGWMLAGSKPDAYETGVDRETVHDAQPSAFLKDKDGNSEGFGTLMQQIRAVQYRGMRLRLSGYVKSEDIEAWAGLWMRVDRDSSVSAFDNMHDRGIKGTTEWQNYEVVLDVGKQATGIAFGILLDGSGRVWLSGTKLEVVSSEIPTTGARIGTRPTGRANLVFARPTESTNLDFTK